MSTNPTRLIHMEQPWYCRCGLCRGENISNLEHKSHNSLSEPSELEANDDSRQFMRFNCHINNGMGAPSRDAVNILVVVAIFPYNHLVSAVVCQLNSVLITGI